MFLKFVSYKFIDIEGCVKSCLGDVSGFLMPSPDAETTADVQIVGETGCEFYLVDLFAG